MTTYLFYFIISVFAVLFLGLYSNVKRNDYPYRHSLKAVLLTLSFLTLFIPLIMRDVSVGTDYISYRDTFMNIINGSGISDSTVRWLGWPFINLTQYIAPLVFNNYVVFYGLTSFATLVFLYATILKSKIPWLSLAIFIGFCLYFQMFNQIRQLFAICIVLYSYRYILDKKILKFSLTVLAASIFHTTALFFLPFYFLSRLRINKKNLAIYVIIGIISGASFSSIIGLIELTSYGQVYLASGFNTPFAPSTIINFGIRFAMLIFCLILAGKVLKDSKNRIFYNLVIYCTILQGLTMFSSLFGRITTMFFIFYILLIPEVIVANFKDKSRKAVVFLTAVILIVYQYVYYSSPNGAESGGYETYKMMQL